MRYKIEAACGNSIGKIRSNNEDNFCFDGICLPAINNGMETTQSYESDLKKRRYVAVFDGMGGENFGEEAAFQAANFLKNRKKRFLELLISEKKYIKKICLEMNNAVLEAAKELRTSRMGTTVAGMSIDSEKAIFFNVGDSRIYKLRSGEITQISEDHVDKFIPRGRKKAPLTQHLGIKPEYFVIEPYITEEKVENGDYYILCSDGLTDMLTNEEIKNIIIEKEKPVDCVNSLINEAMEHGGKDNITVILCKVDQIIK